MATTEIKFTLTLPEVPEIHRLEAEKKAKEAYIMTLLCHGDISAWHKDYTNAPKDGNTWISDDNKRILRGGSWFQDPENCRCAYRNYIVAGANNYGSGFRVACSFG
jgi:hypothetical protein